MRKTAVKWEPNYWQEQKLPEQGCFGYVNGHLILGKGHHQLIMARLIDAGWTWEQLMEAEQAWGWYTLGHTTYDHHFNDTPNHLHGRFVSVRFTSDAGLQNDEAMKGALGAFASLYHLPAKIEEGANTYGIDKNPNKEYGSGLHGLQHADNYLNNPETYFGESYVGTNPNILKNIPQPPGQDWDPDWEEKSQQITNPETPPPKTVSPKVQPTVSPTIVTQKPTVLQLSDFKAGDKVKVTTPGSCQGNIETVTSVGPEFVSTAEGHGWYPSSIEKVVEPGEFKVGDKFHWTPDVEGFSPSPTVYSISKISPNLISLTWPGAMFGASYDLEKFNKYFTKIDPGPKEVPLSEVPGYGNSMAPIDGTEKAYDLGGGSHLIHYDDDSALMWEHGAPGKVYAPGQWKLGKLAYSPGGKTKGWGDIMEKANYIRSQNGVQITNNEPQHVTGTVQSGTDPGNRGPYNTEIWRQDPQSQAISMWDCDCPWDDYAWGRTRQWKKYEGRPCAHVLALYWESLQNQPAGGQGTPVAPPTPTPGGGVTVNQGLIAPMGQPPMQNVPLTGEPGMPAPLGPEPEPQQPAWSEVVQPGKEEGTITFPGTFSHWKEAATQRLFLAYELPEQIVAQVMQWQQANMPEGVYPEPATNLHMTIAFLGDTDVEMIPHLQQILSQINPSQVQLSGPIEYKELDKLAFLALQDSGGNEIVEQLNQQLNELMGYEPQFRPWLPHITVWRFDPTHKPNINPQLPNFGSFSPEAVNVYTSVKNPSGKGGIYQKVASAPIWKEAAFQNGDIVRAWEPTEGFAQPAYGQPGYPVMIKKNQSGEVLFSDENVTVAVFPLSTGPLEHHLVKVECPTNQLYLDNTNAQPFVKKH